MLIILWTVMRQLQLNYEMINHNLWQDFSWLDINISFMAGYKCNKVSGGEKCFLLMDCFVLAGIASSLVAVPVAQWENSS